MIAAVILAAGASRRLGRAKQSIVLDGEMLVERAVRIAFEAGLAPVIVVVRPENDFGPRLEERGCILVLNPEADEGMAASIRLGTTAAGAVGASGAVVMACDQVELRAVHLRELCAEPGRVTGSGYAGRVGIPAYFPADSFAELQRLRGDVGARELLLGAAAVTAEELMLDVDTEDDLLLVQNRFRK